MPHVPPCNKRTSCFIVFLLSLMIPSCLTPTHLSAAQLELSSKPVTSAFGKTDPVIIPLNPGGEVLLEAPELSTTLASYGSGFSIDVALTLTDAPEKATAASLARAAMSAAAVFYTLTRDYDEERPVKASILATEDFSAESTVVLAEATFHPRASDPASFAFPGPAWTVKTAERTCTETEKLYIQTLQGKSYEWKIANDKRENLRVNISAETDAKLSALIGVAPGSVNLSSLILRPFPLNASASAP